MSVLLVEDDIIDQKAVMRTFRKHSVEEDLLIAANGVEAVQLLQSNPSVKPLSLVILDLNMPRMGGLEFLDKLRQCSVDQFSGAKVVVLTSSNLDVDRRKAAEYNVVNFFDKATEYESFEQCLLENVGGRAN